MNERVLSGALVLLLIVVGNAIVKRVALFRSLNIPGSFVAGLLGSVLVLLLRRMEVPFVVSGALRDLLLVFFFVAALGMAGGFG